MAQNDLGGYSEQELFDALVFNSQQRDLAQSDGDEDGVYTCDAYLKMIDEEMLRRKGVQP